MEGHERTLGCAIVGRTQRASSPGCPSRGGRPGIVGGRICDLPEVAFGIGEIGVSAVEELRLRRRFGESASSTPRPLRDPINFFACAHRDDHAETNAAVPDLGTGWKALFVQPASPPGRASGRHLAARRRRSHRTRTPAASPGFGRSRTRRWKSCTPSVIRFARGALLSMTILPPPWRLVPMPLAADTPLRGLSPKTSAGSDAYLSMGTVRIIKPGWVGEGHTDTRHVGSMKWRSAVVGHS